MSMRPIVASVVGEVTDARWGQVLQTPHAYGVVEIHSKAGIARQRGIYILTELTRVFDSPPASLAALEQIAEGVLRHEDVVSLILLVPVGKTLYIVSRGAGSVYLKRDNKLALLVDGEQSLSGDVTDGDVIIAASCGFVRTLSSEEIVGVFDHLSAVEVAEKLTMRLHEKDGGQGGAALIFHVEKTQKEDVFEEATLTDVSGPAPIAPKVRFRRVRAAGRKFTSDRQRAVLRKAVRRMRSDPAFAPKRLIVYGVLALFAVSVFFGVRHQKKRKVTSELTETIELARHAFDEGMALLELNPVKGRERLTEARNLLEPVVQRNFKTPEGYQAADLFEDVSENLTRAMRIYDVEPELFFDVSLLKPGAIATDISLFEETIGILDAKSRTVFTLGIVSKGGKIVGGGTVLSGATNATIYGEKVYVFTPDGVHLVRLSDTQTIPRVIPKSFGWGKIADIASFGGNVYVLDVEKHRIWKYIATEDGFSDMYEYLHPDYFPDLTNATNMAIDGSVWLGTSMGSITRFTSGTLNEFLPQGEDVPLGEAVYVFVSDETEYVYALDQNQYRVVVYDKDGFYIAQYAWQDGTPATQLVVSEKAGKIFLLADGKLYTITLQ